MQGWRVSRTPKHARLTALRSAGVRAFCTGARGLLAERTPDGDWWARCLNGPTGDRRDLLDAAFSEDTERLWFCGENGALGSYDRVTGTIRVHEGSTGRIRCADRPDRSDRPNRADRTDRAASFRAIEVSGCRGDETVTVADERGRLSRLSVSGNDLSMGGVSVPGDGAAVTALTTVGGTLVAADFGGRLSWETDRGWRSRRLSTTPLVGLVGTARHSPSDPSPQRSLVAVEAGGRLYRHALPSEPGRLEAVDPGVERPRAVAAAGDRIVVVGGQRYRNPDDCGRAELAVLDGDRGVRAAPETAGALFGTCLLTDGTVLAVGSAGIVVERKL